MLEEVDQSPEGHYLTKEELKTVSPIAVIDAITDTDEGIVNEIVEENIEIIKSFLATYDVQNIFSRRGSGATQDCPQVFEGHGGTRYLHDPRSGAGK